MTQDEKFEMMTTQPVKPLICKLAIPTIITMMISAMYNMADTYFVGQVGTSATAAVGISFSLMALIQAVGFFFGHGSGNSISRHLGAKDTQSASKIAATGVFSAWITGALVATLGILFLDQLALLLGATPTILPHARAYLRFILIGAPFMCASLTLSNLLRFQGSAVYGMVGMTSGAILNIALDPLLIFGLGMGVQGAAIATAISQTVSCVILYIGCARGGNIRVHPRDFAPRLSTYREITKGGLPSLFRQGLAGVATIVLNQTAGPFGDAAIAAISVVNRVALFAGSALIGFGQGFQPVCGFNYGAGLYKRVRQSFWFCVKVAVIFLAVMSAIGFAFAPQIIVIFRDDPEVVVIGTKSLRLLCLAFPLSGWVIMCNMMMQTIGKAFKASLLAISRQGIFLVAFLLILTPRLGLLGLQMSQPLADVCAFLLALPLGLSVLREMKEQEALETLASSDQKPTA